MQILIVDDNKEILFGLEKLFSESDFKIHTAKNLKEAARKLEKHEFHLIVLDWMLPDGSGVEFLAEHRQRYLSTPVLLLSSKSDALEKVEALDSGADDYMQKPFSNIELLARVRALLRRESAYKKSKVKIDNVEVDLTLHEVFVDGKLLTLTKKEFDLLELLVLNQNTVLTRYQISDHLNPDFDAIKSSNLVDVHIKNLRKKLGTASGVIKTVRGVGFTLKA